MTRLFKGRYIGDNKIVIFQQLGFGETFALIDPDQAKNLTNGEELTLEYKTENKTFYLVTVIDSVIGEVELEKP